MKADVVFESVGAGDLGPLAPGAQARRATGRLRRHGRLQGRDQPAPAVLQAARDHRLDDGQLPGVRPSHDGRDHRQGVRDVDDALPLADYPEALDPPRAGDQLGKIVLLTDLVIDLALRCRLRAEALPLGRLLAGAPDAAGGRQPDPRSSPTRSYVPEELYTPRPSRDEADVLRRYFTNLDGPVFALVNLPEVVKGALFARYSRTPKSLRRLFLDEFVGDLDITGDATDRRHRRACERAEELYEKVFLEYGDDSVAQLGGVHLACEQASNLLTKVLEWGRLMAYLEQTTRYIAYDARLGGRYRYYRDPEVLDSRLGTRYVGDMDRMFDAYAEVVPVLQTSAFQRALPEGAGRQRLRLPPGDPGQGARRGPRHAAGGVAVERRHLRHAGRPTRRCCCACGPTRCPRPGTTPT